MKDIIKQINYDLHNPDTTVPEEIARAKRKHNLDNMQVMELCRRYGCLTEDVAAAEQQQLWRFKRG